MLGLPEGTKFQVLAPIVRSRKGEFSALFDDLSRRGFARARVDGKVVELSEKIRLDRYFQHDIDVIVDRLVIKEGIESRLTDSIETALKLAEGIAAIDLVDDSAEDILFSQHFACTNCGISFDELAPRNFSFNSPYGACDRCDGLGTHLEVDAELVIPNPDLSLDEGAIAPWAGRSLEYFDRLLDSASKAFKFKTNVPFKKLSKTAQDIDPLRGRRHRDPRPVPEPVQPAALLLDRVRRESSRGSNAGATERSPSGPQSRYEQYFREVPCPKCKGARLRPESLAVTLGGQNIFEVCYVVHQRRRRVPSKAGARRS